MEKAKCRKSRKPPKGRKQNDVAKLRKTDKTK